MPIKVDLCRSWFPRISIYDIVTLVGAIYRFDGKEIYSKTLSFNIPEQIKNWLQQNYRI